MSSIGESINNMFGGDGLAPKAAQLSNPLQGDQFSASYDQSKAALGSQQQLAAQLAGQGGLANQSSVFNQQQVLANALQQQAMGQGPNPAQAALANSTGNNISQQAALMAGQRGAGANAGLIAREAGMQGAGIQQQAAGQSAVMQAQQQLAAQQQLQAQQGAMQNVAGQQVQNQMNGVGGFTNAALTNQGQVLGAVQGYNNAQVGATSSLNQANAQRAAADSQMVGGLAQGGGSAAMMMAMADGGMVSDHMHHMMNIYHPMSIGGSVPALLSPGEKYVSPKEAEKVADGKKSLSSAGKKVPGKAEVKGDSLKNDKVPAKLEEGGIVIPRSIMNSDDPVKEGTKFLVESLKKHGNSGKEEDDFKRALKGAIASRSK